MKLNYKYSISGYLRNYESSDKTRYTSGNFRFTTIKPYRISNIPELEEEIKKFYKAENVVISGIDFINVRRRFI